MFSKLRKHKSDRECWTGERCRGKVLLVVVDGLEYPAFAPFVLFRIIFFHSKSNEYTVEESRAHSLIPGGHVCT